MPVPVISVEQMRQWEAATWAAGQSEAEVIRRAGAAVGRAALRFTQPGDRVLILAGKGNNGADARAAEPELTGRTVQTLVVKDPVAGFAAIQSALGARLALVIDGLFGIGLNRPLDAPWLAIIEAVNQSRCPVLSVDVPSGMLADTGALAGGAIRAYATVTLGAPKRGLLHPDALEWVGRLEVAPNIGLIPCPITGDLWWTLPEDFNEFPPARPVTGHKGTFGHLLIVAGSLGYHGAAVLAARGAQRAMPGLITVLTMEEVYAPIATQLQSAMVGVWQPDTRVPESTAAIVFGPGLAAKDVPATLRTKMRRAWQAASFPMLVDASGLDFLSAEQKRHDFWRVMTPHPGEAARLLHTTNDAVQRDRLGTVRELSRRFGDCLVVLKGHQTLIGSAKGPVFINSSGNAGLAQGGSGDVLAGFIGGLLAQRRYHHDFWTAVRYGVWQHGVAADYLASRHTHWTIEDLVSVLGAVPRPG